MTNTWKAPDYAGGYINNVLVICGEGNDSASRNYEDVFVSRLNAMGIKATAAYQVVDPSQKVDENYIRSLANARQYDFVMVSELKNIQTKTENVPGAVYMPLSTGFYPYGGNAPFAPNQTLKFTVGYLETKVYRVQNEAMIWSGESKAFDPHNSQSFVNDVVTTILSGMSEAGLIPPSK